MSSTKIKDKQCVLDIYYDDNIRDIFIVNGYCDNYLLKYKPLMSIIKNYYSINMNREHSIYLNDKHILGHIICNNDIKIDELKRNIYEQYRLTQICNHYRKIMISYCNRFLYDDESLLMNHECKDKQNIFIQLNHIPIHYTKQSLSINIIKWENKNMTSSITTHINSSVKLSQLFRIISNKFNMNQDNIILSQDAIFNSKMCVESQNDLETFCDINYNDTPIKNDISSVIFMSKSDYNILKDNKKYLWNTSDPIPWNKCNDIIIGYKNTLNNNITRGQLIDIKSDDVLLWFGSHSIKIGNRCYKYANILKSDKHLCFKFKKRIS